jgi:hypothetical protein
MLEYIESLLSLLAWRRRIESDEEKRVKGGKAKPSKGKAKSKAMEP